MFNITPSFGSDPFARFLNPLGPPSSGAAAEEPGDGLGPERVVNGGFDTDSDWSGSNWSISGGTANAATTSFARVFSNTSGGSSEVGKTYRVSYTITSISAGSVNLTVPGIGISRTTPGTYTEDVVASAATVPAIRAAANTTASIDNVSIKEVL